MLPSFIILGEFPVIIDYTSFRQGPHNFTIIANSTNGEVAKFFHSFILSDPIGNDVIIIIAIVPMVV